MFGQSFMSTLDPVLHAPELRNKVALEFKNSLIIELSSAVVENVSSVGTVSLKFRSVSFLAIEAV